MEKLLTIFAIAVADFESLSADEVKQNMVDRITSLADVLGDNYDARPKKVGDVNDNAALGLDWHVNKQNIDLAWDYHSASEDDKPAALAAITALADELFEAIPNELEKQKTAQDASVAANQQGSTSVGRVSDQDGVESGGNAETHTIKESVGTVKFNGRYLSGEVELTDDEAEELAEYLV